MSFPISRRDFLGVAAGAAVFPAAAAAAIAGRPSRRLLQMNGYATDAESPLDLLADYRTPNEIFFVRHHWIPKMPDLAAWKLRIEGDVSAPLDLSLQEIRRLPAANATCVLQCAGNGRALYKPVVPGVQWKYGAVGNARWTGARVRDVLEKAGLKGTARYLHTFGSDDPPGKVPPFHRSVEIEKVLQDGILAYEMNGEPLPPLHGAPLRLIVPGWAGDHWMKWLVRLSAEPRPQTGFYMDVAYRYPKQPGAPGVAFKPDEMEPVTELAVKSNFVEAPRRARTGRPAVLRGFAFSGAPDVSRVELSDDDGRTWAAAELSPEHDPFAWRLWSYRWTPRARGKATVWVRATDSRGSVQPREAVWNQSGYLYNGWHSAEIEVTP